MKMDPVERRKEENHVEIAPTKRTFAHRSTLVHGLKVMNNES